MKNATPISCCELKSFGEFHANDAVRQAMKPVFAKNNMGSMAFVTGKAKKMQFFFNHEVKTMSATNQKSSGRCWLFAATNVLREIVGKKLNVEQFELSQSWLAFWDKFERVNYYIEAIADTADQPANSRVVDYIVETGVHDGGQWDMFTAIVKKYGIVPKSVYPETFQSSNTGSLNRHINNYLRAKTPLIRRLAQEGKCEELAALRTEILEKTYSFLCACYDVPPTEFDFEYQDKDKNVVVEKGLTPVSFCEKYIGNYLDDYVSIVHAPTADKPFDKLYTVQYLGNVVGGAPVRHLNLELCEFKRLVAEQIKDGEIVWFGSDCGKFSDGERACWDVEQYNEDLITGFDTAMSKADMLDYHVSAMNHAMCLTGVNIGEDGKPNRWKIENSWGDGGAHGGYHMASDAWFDAYVFQAVVNKKYLGEKAALLDQELIELEPWDPMGSLAG